MAKKDDRNLNITIKNQEDQKDEVVISISTLLKKLKKYLLIWIVAAVVFFIAAFGYATITTHVKKASLVALINFSYDGIEKGLDPAGREFDPYSVKNPAVIEAALDELGMDMTELENIRQGISIDGIKPKDAVDRITLYDKVLESNGNVSSVEKILETSYFPTQYKVYFDYNNTELSDDDAVDVFNTILECYKTYFYETYGYNESLGSAVTAINYADYDYSEAVDVFRTSIGTLKTYVRQLANEDSTRFRSSVTGYTFDDLYEAIKTVESIDLDKISSYVTVNNLTKDKDEALAYYEYRIKALNRTKAQLEEEIAAYDASIASYQKDEIIIFGNGTDDTNTQSTIASQQYDKMIQSKNNIAASLAETKQSINYYKERQEALKNNPVGSSDKTEKVESELASLNEKINELVELVSLTSEDYYKNVTFKNAYSVLVPATNTASDRLGHIVSNAKMPLVALEALGLVVFFAVAFIEALVADSKKRKAEAGLIPADAEDEESASAEEAAEDIADAVVEAAEADSEPAEEKKNKKKNKSPETK